MSGDVEPAQPEASARRAPPRPLAGAIFVGIALAIWWPAFTLGAWGEVFFTDLLAIWVAATVGLVVVLAQPRPATNRAGRALALAVPSLWLALSFVDLETTDPLTFVVDLLAIVVAIAGVPFTIVVLARIIWPDFGHGLPRWRVALGIGTVAVIAVVSFLLGVFQEEFLTCEQFTISGNSAPPGCRSEPDVQPAG